MCPIHDTDSPEERWSKAEWEHYELWEKLEARLRIRRRWIVFACVVLFLGLSSIPIVVDSGPQWRALRAMRELGEHLSRIKRQAVTRELALRVSVDPSEPLLLRVERAASCRSAKFEPDEAFRLLTHDKRRAELGWLDPVRGQEVGIPGLLTRFCYDPLLGSSVTPGPDSVAAFVVLPVKELTEEPKHHAVLLLRGPSAEISFE
jgi:hypothetical protein